MTQPLDRSANIPQVGKLDTATGEFWREHTFEMGRGDDNLSAYEPNRMFLNLDGKKFLDCSFGSGCDIDADSRSVVAADFNRDGAADILVGSVGGGPLRLFANRFPDSHHKLRVKLIGVKSNRFGIGSRVVVTTKDKQKKIIRDMFPVNGCLGQSPTEMLIGVGNADTIDQLEVRWPNGNSQTFVDLPVDGVITITEGDERFRFARFTASQGVPTGSARFKPIDTPRLKAGNSRVDADQRILGVTLGSNTRAYPVRYMEWHQLCHDEVAGSPLLISYSPPAAAGTAFHRRLKNLDKELTLTFDVAGMMQAVGYTVIRDRQTQSLWNPITGQCVKGKLRGTTLRKVPMLTTDWGHWKTLNPATGLLAAPLASYPEAPEGNSNSGSRHVQGVRDSCPPDSRGIGIRGEGQQLFIPLDDLGAVRGGFVSGRLDGQKIVVLYAAEAAAANSFYAQTSKDEPVNFSQSLSNDGRFVSQDGSVFDLMGRCLSGPLAGKKLKPIVDATTTRWYAWNLTFPQTFVVRMKR